MSFKKFSGLGILTLSLAFAAQASALTAKQTVEKEIVTVSADGTQTVRLEPAALVVPGETVVYTVDFVNDSAEPATDLVLAMPIPSDVRYLEGTAEREGATLLFSSDGGATFQPRDAMEIPAVGGGSRNARAEDLTHIQWTIAGPVPVGAADKVRFKARLK